MVRIRHLLLSFLAVVGLITALGMAGPEHGLSDRPSILGRHAAPGRRLRPWRPADRP